MAGQKNIVWKAIHPLLLRDNLRAAVLAATPLTTTLSSFSCEEIDRIIQRIRVYIN
jgi:hypothetical protein